MVLQPDVLAEGLAGCTCRMQLVYHRRTLHGIISIVPDIEEIEDDVNSISLAFGRLLAKLIRTQCSRAVGPDAAAKL